MKNHTAPMGAIVVGVAEPTSGAALRWAAEQAAHTSRPLHVVHVIEGLTHAPVDLEDHVDHATEGTIGQVLETYPGLRVTAATDTGSAAAALVAASHTAEMVVVGAPAHGVVTSVVLGSVSLQVATHGACPVVVVHDRPAAADAPEGRVVVGLDASERSEQALEFGFEQASRRGIGLTAVACWSWEDSGGNVPGPMEVGLWENAEVQDRRLVSELLAGWHEKYPDVSVQRRLVPGRTVPTLLKESEGAALLVVGSRGRGGFAGLLLGSVSQRILERATCPVAIVPSPGVVAEERISR